MTTLTRALPRNRYRAVREAADATWPDDLREQLITLDETYELTQREPFARFFRAAWNRGCIAGAARLWLDAVGRHKRFRAVAELIIEHDDVVIEPGSLRVSGSVFLKAGMLIVGGDLEVGSELGDATVGQMIIVEGNVRCGVLGCSGGVIVGGDLEAARLVWASSDEDRVIVAGKLVSPLTIINFKTIEAATLSTLRAETSMTFGAIRKLITRLDPSFVLDDAALDEDGDDEEELELAEFVDLEAIYQAALEGRAIVRPLKATRTVKARGKVDRTPRPSKGGKPKKPR